MTRRELLTLGLGAAAAVPLTPVPWKLLDDSSKWTQNWNWIPRPPRGEPSVKYSSCTLCSAGCGIAARCVGPNVIGIAPVAEHPVSKGVLCPIAFGAHQLPFHPARLTCPLRRGRPARIEEVTAEIAGRVKAGRFAIVDERPGRAVSEAYQRIAAANGGAYIAPVAGNGLALEDVRTIVSLGAPVLEYWATPGRVLELWGSGRLAVVQVEESLSRTGALAAKSLIVRQGSGSMVTELLAGKAEISAASKATGVAQEKLADVVRFVKERGAMISVAGEPPRIAILDGEIDTLLIDHGPLGGSTAGSLSRDVLQSKLRPGGVIVSLSPYRAGVAAAADYAIPTPAFGEALEEAPTPWDATAASYALAPPLRGAPAGITTPCDFITKVTASGETQELAIERRVEKLHAAKRGAVFAFRDRTVKAMSDFKTAADLRKAFDAGACWTDPEANQTPAEFRGARSGRKAIDVPLLAMLRRNEYAS
jgi:hypothetical protein